MQPEVVVLDVDDALSDLERLRERFADIGAPGELAPLWFASLLRDGLALAATGQGHRFLPVAEETAFSLLAGASLKRPADEAVRHILTGFTELPVHRDVPEGVRLLASQGIRLVTLSSGAAALTGHLLTRAGLSEYVERTLSAEDAGTWRPAPAAYQCAARACGTAPRQMMLVTAHPWDIHGAHRAGLRTAWINRDERPCPGYFAAPDLHAADLDGLARQIVTRQEG